MNEYTASTTPRWILRASILSICTLVTWSAIAKIDQSTRAQALIIASGRTQVIQSPESGVLTKLHIKEGDSVKEGQLLATLEKDRAQAAVNDSRAKVAALKITLTRLQAEVYGQPLNFAAELKVYQDYIRNQTQLFNKRKSAIDQDVASLQAMLVLSDRELEMNRKLQTTGDVSNADVLKLERTAADIQAQITNKRNKYFQDAQAEMTKAQEELSTQNEQLRDRNQVLEHTELRAPTAGVVKNVKLTTIGAVVKPGDVVLEILPTDGDLIVEAKISPTDIASVALGQYTNVKIDAFDYSVFGSMQGEVTYISADTLTEDTKQGPQAYYRVLVRIKGAEVTPQNGETIQPRPGMTASVEIKARERTVLSYLTKPITKTLNQSLSER